MERESQDNGAQRNLLEVFEKRAIHALAIGHSTAHQAPGRNRPQVPNARALSGHALLLIRPDHHPLLLPLRHRRHLYGSFGEREARQTMPTLPAQADTLSSLPLPPPPRRADQDDGLMQVVASPAQAEAASSCAQPANADGPVPEAKPQNTLPGRRVGRRRS